MRSSRASLRARAARLAREPSVVLLLAAVAVLLVPLVSGLAPLAPSVAFVFVIGGDLEMVYGLLIVWGALPLITVVSGLPGAAGLALAAVEIHRVRSRWRAWLGLGCALPLVVASAAVQVLLTPCTGIASGLFCTLVVLFAVIRGAMAMNDLVLDVGFDQGDGDAS